MPAPRRIETPAHNAAKLDEDLEQGLRVTIGEESYEFRVGDVTPVMERKLRKELGVSLIGLMEEAYEQPGLDTIAGVAFLSRLVNGDDDVRLADIPLSYRQIDDLDLVVVGKDDERGAEDPNSPEA